jgi:hypothetical protein
MFLLDSTRLSGSAPIPFLIDGVQGSGTTAREGDGNYLVKSGVGFSMGSVLSLAPLPQSSITFDWRNTIEPLKR